LVNSSGFPFHPLCKCFLSATTAPFFFLEGSVLRHVVLPPVSPLVACLIDCCPTCDPTPGCEWSHIYFGGNPNPPSLHPFMNSIKLFSLSTHLLFSPPPPPPPSCFFWLERCFFSDVRVLLLPDVFFNRLTRLWFFNPKTFLTPHASPLHPTI